MCASCTWHAPVLWSSPHQHTRQKEYSVMSAPPAPGKIPSCLGTFWRFLWLCWVRTVLVGMLPLWQEHVHTKRYCWSSKRKHLQNLHFRSWKLQMSLYSCWQSQAGVVLLSPPCFFSLPHLTSLQLPKGQDGKLRLSHTLAKNLQPLLCHYCFCIIYIWNIF